MPPYMVYRKNNKLLPKNKIQWQLIGFGFLLQFFLLLNNLVCDEWSGICIYLFLLVGCDFIFDF